MFTYVRDSHSRTTRLSVKKDLYLPTGKNKELYIQSFAYSGANIWNSINPDIRNQRSLNSFKPISKIILVFRLQLFNVIVPFLTFLSCT